MDLVKDHIIHQLKKDILSLEGMKVLPSDLRIKLDFPPIESAFPQGTFPVGCMHEMISDSTVGTAANYGFLAFLLSKFMRDGGMIVWIGSFPTLFPAALKAFGLEPDKIIFINLKKNEDRLWTLEESLRCEQFSAVIGEIGDINFKESRRLQLAAEKSRVTGFILRQPQKKTSTIACVSRWKVTSLPGNIPEGMPGVGFPRWEIDLMKIRNGSPGKWEVEWRTDGIHDIREKIFAIPANYKIKTG